MNVVEFDAVLSEFSARERALLTSKRSEYAGDEECLSNFKEVSSWLGMTPERYAMVLALKHIHAISKAVRSGEFTWAWTTLDGGEGLKQRIADARNLLLLTGALLEDQQ